MTPDIHTLAGAYALDAIEPDERAAFEAHLVRCDSCRQEVDTFRQATAALGESLATPPPPQLRARVLALAERTPQLPPAVREAAPGRRPRRTTRWLAAAAAVVALATGGVAVQQALQDDEPPAEPTAAEVFDSSDARTTTIDVVGGEARIGVSDELGLMAVDAEGLPPLRRDRVYQLWVIDDAGIHSAGVVDEPSVTLDIPEPGAQVALTREPAGGSEQPTTDPLFAVEPSEL
jgi:anti-sigma-K factor RskA